MKNIYGLKCLLVLLFCLGGMSSQGATITVTNTLDAGAGSLRQAITTANANPMDADNIVFAIPTSDPGYNPLTGVYTISVASMLPYVLSMSVTIDGTTQPNTNPNGPEICLRSATPLLVGLAFPLTGGVAKGLIIQGFQAGIVIVKYGAYPGGACTVSDCYLGVNYDGTLAVPNEIGVLCYGGVTNNTIINNLISGNNLAGVGLRNAHNNAVKGNKIGTDRTGLFKIPNYYGVALDSATTNTIGGPTPADRNVISGNSYAGVAINNPMSNNNVVLGNYIGTNMHGLTRIDTISNYYGIAINESPSNILGGASAAARNLISGNREAGIAMLGAGSRNTSIKGNYIGTNVLGMDSIPNANGILISGSPANIIGGAAVGERNIISGNRLAGIAMAYSGTRGNIIKGNYIGVDISGTQILSNYAGIYLKSNANSNIIGGSTAGERNVISGNLEMGLCIETSDSNSILGNYIGPDATGSGALRLSNDTLVQANGLYFNANARYNTAGGYNPGEGNVISGNRVYGHDIYGNSSYNATIGNYIGVDASGTVAMPNATGICVDGGSNHNPFINNVISGNRAYGMFIVTTGSNYNELRGNRIGTNAAGTDTIPNQCGLLLGGGTKYNVIGGSNAADRNLFSGNRFDGILVADTGTMYNNILGNYIGTDVSGTSALPNKIGIGFATRATQNTVDNNVISGNRHIGMILYEGCNSNMIYRNKIGIRADESGALANHGAGVVLSKSCRGNSIGGSGLGNVIAYNDTVGVVIMDTGSYYNKISQNRIFANNLMDIDLYPYGVNANDAGDADQGANGLMNYPLISSVFLDWFSGNTTITGGLDHASPVGVTLELFKAGGVNMFGHGGGETYLGSVVITDPAGLWSFETSALAAGDVVTATAIDANGNTSEFAANMSLTVGIAEESAAGSGLLLWPNPASDELFVQVRLEEAQAVTLRLYNVNGALVAAPQAFDLSAGEHTLRLDAVVRQQASGLYLLQLTGDEGLNLQQRLMIQKP